MPSSLPVSPIDVRRSWLLMALLWLVLLVLAATRPLALPDEGRYAEISRWMLRSGDWLTPRLDGLPFFHKPPLLHWLQAALMGVLGVHVWVARLVPALHAGLMMVALYLASRSVWGEAVARRAALMLGTSLGFLLGGQYINHDMVVAAWIGVALWCFAASLAHEGGVHAGLARGGFVACALAVLAKGLIGIVLPGGVLLVWLVVTRRLPRLLRLPWASGLALFSLVALPWFVSQQRQFPGFFDYLIVGQHFSRFTQATYNNQQPVWFYPVLLLVLLPWSLFALADAVRWCKALVVRRGWTRPADDPWRAFLWVWLAVITLFFSLPRSKLVGYILPVLPPLAVLSALGWQRWMAARARAGTWWAAGAALCVGLAVLLHVVVARHTTETRSSDDIAHALSCRMKDGDTVMASGGNYPYDLPFLADLRQPLGVVADWAHERQHAGDNWRRELFEGADFDAQAAQVLLPWSALDAARERPAQWLVLPNDDVARPRFQGWLAVEKGRAWTLLQSPASAAKGPETSQQVGLGRCR